MPQSPGVFHGVAAGSGFRQGNIFDLEIDALTDSFLFLEYCPFREFDIKTIKLETDRPGQADCTRPVRFPVITNLPPGHLAVLCHPMMP